MKKKKSSKRDFDCFVIAVNFLVSKQKLIEIKKFKSSRSLLLDLVNFDPEEICYSRALHTSHVVCACQNLIFDGLFKNALVLNENNLNARASVKCVGCGRRRSTKLKNHKV